MSAPKVFFSCIRTLRVSPSAVLPFVLCLSNGSYAQKAQPVRIPSREGKVSNVQGRLRGGQQMEYEVRGQGGQTLTVRLFANPPGTAVLKLYAPNGDEMITSHAKNPDLIAKLPESGDYGISVLRTSASRAVSAYKLKVTIR